MTNKQKTYHHGDLKDSLIMATDAILRESGIEGFSLREAARRAGVSPGAPAHHFGNAVGLLTEVAIMGYQELGRYLDDGLNTDLAPNAQMRALATAYIAFAQDHPGRFRLMFRKDLVNRSNVRYQEESWQALIKFAVVTARIKGTTLESLLEARDHAAIIAAWSLAHGVAQLVLEDKFKDSLNEDPDEDLRNRLLPEILKTYWP